MGSNFKQFEMLQLLPSHSGQSFSLFSPFLPSFPPFNSHWVLTLGQPHVLPALMKMFYFTIDYILLYILFKETEVKTASNSRRVTNEQKLTISQDSCKHAHHNGGPSQECLILGPSPQPTSSLLLHVPVTTMT